jgi:hypothetical protein
VPSSRSLAEIYLKRAIDVSRRLSESALSFQMHAGQLDIALCPLARSGHRSASITSSEGASNEDGTVSAERHGRLITTSNLVLFGRAGKPLQLSERRYNRLCPRPIVTLPFS